MRRWLGIGGVVGVVGVLMGACTGASEPYPDVQSFCAARASAECQVASACLTTASACTTARQAACMSDAAAATKTGTRSYTPGAAQACLTAVQAAYAAPPIQALPVANSMVTSLQDIDTACQAVFSGSVPPNGKCTSNYDCAQGSDTGTPQVCAPIAPGSATTECTSQINVAVGSPCANFGSVCALGSYCHGTPAICKEGGGTGAACSTAQPCGVGAFCNIAKGAKTGSCETGGAPGAACAASQDCGTMAPYCDPNVPPKSGAGTAIGSCVPALFSLGSSSDDCKAYGAM